MHLLLVDDDLFLRDMYATKFSELGHTVEAVVNGQEALTKLSEQKFDVVLLDMVMPVMTGIDFLRSVKETYPDIETKFIVLSNQGEESDRAAAKEAGAAGYIVKAESIPSDVVAKVEELIKS
ncbi:response regulator [Candidatus Kaiserbacteria bacterium]|nr:response regulator [Candidatus Kaiserbacteria bacterium]MCB9811354.1 response regulator [Candidatus Nomurabacteria bacterium]